MNPSIFIAALLGLVTGGPFGALALGGIAWYLQRDGGFQLSNPFRRLAEIQDDFLDTTFAVMGHVAKSDGRVSEAEIEAAEKLFRQLRLDRQARKRAQEAFVRGKQPDFDLEEALARFARVSGGMPALTAMFVQVQLTAVAADGTLHPQERDLLLHIARRLELPQEQYARLEEMLSGPGGVQGPTLEQAYATLGLSPSASDAELKKAYRKLVSENHPDKLAGKGMPESMRPIAEERTREIIEAYDRIMETR